MKDLPDIEYTAPTAREVEDVRRGINCAKRVQKRRDDTANISAHRKAMRETEEALTKELDDHASF